MKNLTIPCVLALALTLFALGCGSEADDHDQGAGADNAHVHGHGVNGGHLIELGTAGHLEILHDLRAGTISLYLTGPDAETAVPIAKSPVLKMVTDEGPKVLQTNSKNPGGDSAEYHVQDDILKTEPKDLRVSLEFQGKTYNPNLGEHDH